MLRANFRLFRGKTGFPDAPNPIRSAVGKKQQTVAAIGGLAVLALCMGCGTGTGPVSSTSNAQMALYVFQTRTAGSVTVEFGPTTTYGFETSPVTSPAGGGPIRIFVAGMRANTTYHMRAVATYLDGTSDTDTDRTFTTGSYPITALPKITAATSPGQTPQPGIEIVNVINGPGSNPGSNLVATDLSGNVIWAYLPSPAIASPDSLQAPKLLPNGDFVFLVTPGSSSPLPKPGQVIPAGTPDVIREVNLLGDTVKQLTIAQLNMELAANNYNLTLQTFHHDVTPLPNGHWLVLTNTLKNVILTGQTTPVSVLGDVVIDLDTNLNPVWVWNEFDHLDVNRHPWNFPDWTHSNAIIYSPDDGNFIVSIRHQNWLVKVDYNNGAGTGNIIWHLGEGGDFKLVGGTDPTDWFYAQHGPSFTTANTTGIYGLTLMDNGDDRMYPGGAVGVTCGTNGAAACYSTIPVFQINESTMTATLTSHQILPANLYNSFGGNSETVDNGDIEYDLCGLPTLASQISEVTNDPNNPQSVWNLNVASANAYRGYRSPSLYPGVQW